MIFYAIRQKSTGHFLPGDTRSGYTRTEPADPASRPPRLFVNRASAKQALDCWLMGIWSLKTISYGVYDDVEYDQIIDTPDKPEEGRNRDDMEVVQLVLKRPGPEDVI